MTDTSTDEVEPRNQEGEEREDPVVARIHLPLSTADLAALLSSIQNVFPGSSVEAVQAYKQNGFLLIRNSNRPVEVGQ